MFRRAQGATDESMAGYIYGVRRASLVLFSRFIRCSFECVDSYTAYDEYTVHTHTSVHKFVQSFLDGATQSSTEQHFRTFNGRIHHSIRIHHGYQSASGHGQVSELSEVRTGRRHRARTIRHRYASTIGFQQPHIAIFVRRETGVRKNVRSIFNHQQ